MSHSPAPGTDRLGHDAGILFDHEHIMGRTENRSVYILTQEFKYTCFHIRNCILLLSEPAHNDLAENDSWPIEHMIAVFILSRQQNSIIIQAGFYENPHGDLSGQNINSRVQNL